MAQTGTDRAANADGTIYAANCMHALLRQKTCAPIHSILLVIWPRFIQWRYEHRRGATGYRLVVPAFGAAILVPYFMLSERVKNTFVG